MTDKDNNSGTSNSGYCNSGNKNSGNGNSGNWNSGNGNSGYCNSGYKNSGSRNSGHCNSGYGNSGYGNSGDWNSGDYNSGHFNTDEPTVRMFNKDTGLLHSEINLPYISLPLNEWNNNKQKLVTLDYKDAWKLAWSKLSTDAQQEFLDLPNFDAKIFTEITGVVVQSKPATPEDEIILDGVRYKRMD